LPEAGVPAELEESNMVRMTEAVVKEAAAHGRVVLVGRAAPAVLAREGGALHVKLVAARTFRIGVVMERNATDAKTAERTMDDTDAQRTRYNKEYYHRDWNDPVHYHMVLNTGLLGFEVAADLIVQQARAMGW